MCALGGSCAYEHIEAASAVNSSQPVHLSSWTKEGAVPSSGFGHWVASAGDVNRDGFADVLITAPNTDADRGQVFLFLGSAEGLSSEPAWTAFGESRDALFGAVALGVGDVNKDGFADVIVGAPYQANGALERAGCAYFFLGSTNGLSSQPVWICRGQLEIGGLTGNGGMPGDFNGDGFADVIISVPRFRKGDIEIGRVMIFYGSSAGLKNEPDWIQDGEQISGAFGANATSAGDVNRDGFDDLLVGTQHYDGKFMDEGKAFLFLGSSNGLSYASAWTATYDPSEPRAIGGPALQLFANTTSAGGDVNHDGYADVLVTAYLAEKDHMNEGLAFLYLGGPNGLSKRPAWMGKANQEEALFGTSGAGLGDVNGDGFSDIIIGASQASHGHLHEGGAFVFYGSKKGLAPEADWSAESDQALTDLGRCVARAGDVNGDGYDDVLIATTRFSRNGEHLGKVWLHYGGPGGLTGSSGWKLQKPWLAIAAQRVNNFMFRRGWLMAWLGSAMMAVLVVGLWQLRRKRAASERLAGQHHRQLIDERARFARDIHDSLGTDLHHLAILSQAAADDPGGTDERHKQLARIKERAQQLAGAVKELVWLTNPRHDSLGQFADFISEYAADFFEPTGLRCELAFPTSLPSLAVPAEIRHQMLLIVKEACHNVVKHAHSSVVRISLALEGQLMRLTIADDGKGFELNQPSSGNGVGNMRRRASEIGAHLHIATAPSRGTRIQIEVALDKSLACLSMPEK